MLKKLLKAFILSPRFKKYKFTRNTVRTRTFWNRKPWVKKYLSVTDVTNGFTLLLKSRLLSEMVCAQYCVSGSLDDYLKS